MLRTDVLIYLVNKAIGTLKNTSTRKKQKRVWTRRTQLSTAHFQFLAVNKVQKVYANI
jgi:hypothetical protein